MRGTFLVRNACKWRDGEHKACWLSGAGGDDRCETIEGYEVSRYTTGSEINQELSIAVLDFVRTDEGGSRI